MARDNVVMKWGLHSLALWLCPLVLALGVVPTSALAADGAACCLRGSSTGLNQLSHLGKDPDERFFTVTGAPPNLMFVLDTSGSMMDMPVDPSSASVRGAGTRCANTILNAIATAGAFDQAAPAGTYPQVDRGVAPCPGPDCWAGDTGFSQLFAENSFYRYRAWTTTTATAQTAASACSGTSDAAECQTCVNTKGYYLDPSSSLDSRQVLSGKFLNFYPPKFVAARTVLKRVIWGSRGVRMGLTILNGSTGGTLISGMNPPCQASLNPGDAGWENNRKALINEINNPLKVAFAGATPLAETLLNVGQYFTSDDTVFNTWFGTGWTPMGFRNAAITSENRSVCFGCQVTSVVIVTDGAPCNDNCAPQCIRRQNVTCVGCDQQDCGCSGTCPSKCGNGSSCTASGTGTCCSGGSNYLDDVAKWLYDHDLQTKNPTNGSWSADGKQRLATYTVGFGLDHPLLTNTAAVGGGKYYTANDGASLEAALLSVVVDVNKRATSFGVATISTLQTSSGGSSVLPRFIPGSANEPWRGYLFHFRIASELVNGCLPTVAPDPPHAKDLNEDGDCSDMFYEDAEGDVVEEEPVSGLFYKRGTSVPAVPLWEAGKALKYANPTFRDPEADPSLRDPGTRSIWTVYDSNADGKLDATDDMIEFTTANAAWLMPYMGIGDDVTSHPVCSSLYTSLGITSPAKSAWGGACAQAIIEHYRGKRSLDPDPAVRTQPRDWILQDIFHSSPVVVEPPVAAEACSFFRGQCLTSLFQKAGKADAMAQAAYTEYVTQAGGPCGSEPCERRRRLVVVGSNGGFLHAFDNGLVDATASPPRELITNRLKYTAGTGREVWAFIPPDLLANLAPSLNQHGYFVDGTAMVRDVWVDNVDLALGDGNKARDEFKTVLVSGTRGGGSRFFALDISRHAPVLPPGDRPKPRFLWMWPQPCDPVANQLGESVSNFHPRPPPIGPVLLDTTTTLHAYGFPFPYRVYDTAAMTWQSRTATAQERWAVMLNGGGDRAMIRGRGFAMVDVASGKALWQEFHAPTGTPAQQRLVYPIAAGIGMLDVGSGEYQPSGATFDSYFDSASFGDLGGNLWMARFYEPGKIDSLTGRVNNWSFARAFQSETTPDVMAKRRAISFITTNVIQPETGYLRTFFGTGERGALLHQGGDACSVDNLGACISMGCRVSSRYEVMGDVPYAQETVWNAGTVVSSTSGTQPCAGTCNVCQQHQLRAYVQVDSCPAATTQGAATLVRDAKWNCTQPSASVASCTLSTTRNDLGQVTYRSTAYASLPMHKFYGVHTLGPTRIFQGASSAEAFDAARLTETNLVNLGKLSAPSGATAGPLQSGWFLEYDSIDERTASASGVAVSQDFNSGCLVWNTMTPSTSGQVCSGTGSQQARLIQADYVTGSPQCMLSFEGQRFATRTTLVPPPEPTSFLAVTAAGIVHGLIFAEPGRNPVAPMSAQDNEMVQTLYQLELNEPEHVCRHRQGGATCGR